MNSKKESFPKQTIVLANFYSFFSQKWSIFFKNHFSYFPRVWGPFFCLFLANSYDFFTLFFYKFLWFFYYLLSNFLLYYFKIFHIFLVILECFLPFFCYIFYRITYNAMQGRTANDEMEKTDLPAAGLDIGAFDGLLRLCRQQRGTESEVWGRHAGGSILGLQQRKALRKVGM